MGTATLEEFGRRHGRAVARIFRRAAAERWSLTESDFTAALERSVASRFRDVENPRSGDVDDYLDSLNAEDLALAWACRSGSQSGWEEFLRRYRPMLLSAARALTREESRAREIVDSLYAELYGLEEREGRRRSLLEYFYGRSSLATWLRAVVARRHVDACRAAAHSQSLEDGNPREAATSPSVGADPPDPDRGRYLDWLRESLTSALAALATRDRLRLSYYYLQELTLAEIGRLLDEHESTVSRKLDRSRRSLRKQVERRLRRDMHLSDEQIEVCYEYALEDWPFDLGRVLSDSV